MKHYFIHSIILLTLWLTATAGAAEQIKVYAQIDTSATIYAGESFSFHIVIDGDNRPGQVDLSALRKFNPQPAGNRDLSQTSVSIINGKTTRRQTKRYVMNYTLVSSQQGRLTIPSATVTVNAKKYRTRPVTINVVKPGATDKLELEVTLSEEKCYTGQPVVMSVKLYIIADIDDLTFNIPIFNSNRFFFEDPDSIGAGARQMRISASSSQSAYVRQKRTTHKGKTANVLSFEKVLIPKNPGTLNISASSVSANVAVGRKRSFFGYENTYKRFMVSSEALKLEVLPLPEDGKPKEFYGLVGRYSISASAEPTQVIVGEPITLTIRIGGNKYLKAVRWPELEKIVPMAENFKIPPEHSPAVMRGNVKVFTQTIRANNDKVIEIPPIPLAYFDADKGRYTTATTKAIKLVVDPTRILTEADFEGRSFIVANKEIEAIKQGLSANYENMDALTNQSFSSISAAFSPGYAVVWMGPFAILVISSIFRFFTHTSAEKTAAKRRRSALSKVIKQLKKIHSSEAKERPELLGSLMKQYLGDRFDRTALSLTSQDCHQIIIDAINDQSVSEEYRNIIADCEASRFASVETGVDAQKIKQVIELMRGIEKKARK